MEMCEHVMMVFTDWIIAHLFPAQRCINLVLWIRNSFDAQINIAVNAAHLL